MDKFKMKLTWHSCLTCPPEEDFNGQLYVTDGEDVHHAEYSKDHGWWSWSFDDYWDEEDLKELWWADIVQTVHNTPQFTETRYV